MALKGFNFSTDRVNMNFDILDEMQIGEDNCDKKCLLMDGSQEQLVVRGLTLLPWATYHVMAPT
jgi:hypothetical protein